jgi:MFS family permease
MENPVVSRRNFVALILEKAGFFFGLSFAGPYTVLTALAAQLTTSPVLIGSVTTVWNGAAFAPVIFVARWIRNHPERMPIIRRATLVRGVAFVPAALWLAVTRAQNPGLTLAVLIACMLVFCVADGVNSIPYVDVIARIMTSRERSRMSWQGMLAGGLLSIIGSLVVQRVLAPGVMEFPLNFALLLSLAALCFLGALAAISLIPERDVQGYRPHHVTVAGEGGPRALGEILRHDAVYRRMLLTRFLTNTDQMAVPFYTVFALTVLKLSPEAVGLFVAAQTVGSMLGPITFGRIAERAGAHRVIQTAAFTQAAGPLLGLLFVALSAVVPALGWGIVLTFVLAGLSASSMALGYYNYPLDWCPDHDRPSYMALLSVVSTAAMAAPLLGGFIAQTFSYTALFALTAVLVGAGALAGLTLPDKRRG